MRAYSLQVLTLTEQTTATHCCFTYPIALQASCTLYPCSTTSAAASRLNSTVNFCRFVVIIHLILMILVYHLIECLELLNHYSVGRVYQQTFVDTYSKIVHCKLYVTKTPITAADLLNDKVLPFYNAHHLPMLRILTDRGTEFCGSIEKHDYQLYLAINDIDHTKTKAMSPQTNGICERFHKTILHEFYMVTFRKKRYSDLETRQTDLDNWLHYYNNERTHQGKMCCGRTPMEILLDGKRIWEEKNLNQI
jgi:hypothetical protein